MCGKASDIFDAAGFKACNAGGYEGILKILATKQQSNSLVGSELGVEPKSGLVPALCFYAPEIDQISSARPEPRNTFSPHLLEMTVQQRLEELNTWKSWALPFSGKFRKVS
jgi:hypothetical protein